MGVPNTVGRLGFERHPCLRATINFGAPCSVRPDLGPKGTRNEVGNLMFPKFLEGSWLGSAQADRNRSLEASPTVEAVACWVNDYICSATQQGLAGLSWTSSAFHVQFLFAAWLARRVCTAAALKCNAELAAA